VWRQTGRSSDATADNVRIGGEPEGRERNRHQAATGAGGPKFAKDEFDSFLECRILAHGFLRLRGTGCGHDKLFANSRNRRGFGLSCGLQRVAQTAAHRFEPVMPRVPVRQWVLALPIAPVFRLPLPPDRSISLPSRHPHATLTPPSHHRRTTVAPPSRRGQRQVRHGFSCGGCLSR